MIKGKGTSGGCGSTPKSFANSPLKDSFTTEMSAPKSSRHLNDIIMKESREVDTVKIEIIKKLLKNIKR